MLQKSEIRTLLNVILIDDHPHTIEFYKNSIISLNPEFGLNFIVAKNCEEANNHLLNLKQSSIKVDLAIVDIGLPPFKHIETGADIAILIKNDFKECKIIVVTAFTEPLTIYNLLRKTTIEAILCKSDMDNDEFIKVYETVLKGKTYRSRTILEKMTTIAKNKFNLDHYDLEILKKLQEGKKTSDLTNYYLKFEYY